MSIFQREGGDPASPSASPTRRPQPAAGGQQTTVVAAGSRVQGEISGATDVLIDGQVEGQLILGGTVVVGEAGEVKGQIEARQVKIGGRVEGDIRASERIEVLESGRIEGDVSAPRVAINAGAFFKGKVEMTSDAAQAQAVQSEASPSKPPASRPAPEAKPQPEQKRLDDSGSSSASAAEKPEGS